MTIFVERGLGARKTLSLSRKPGSIFDEEDGYAEAHTYYLRNQANHSPVAHIWFQCGGRARTLCVLRLEVLGHSNEAAARNPFPGVGRLLMYLACKYAMSKGGETVEVFSLLSAVPFYRRMGMHPACAQDSMIDSHGQLGKALKPASLQESWLREFNKKFNAIQQGNGNLTARTTTVLSNIEAAVQAQWEEQESHFAGFN